MIENHRQQGDSHYADILNRIRVGETRKEDIEFLNKRVRPEGHADMKGATVIASKHVAVNKYNRLGMEEINSELFEIHAINSHSNIPDYIPKIDVKKGTDRIELSMDDYAKSLEMTEVRNGSPFEELTHEELKIYRKYIGKLN